MNRRIRSLAAACGAGAVSALLALFASVGVPQAGAAPGQETQRDGHRPLNEVDVVFSPSSIQVDLYTGDSTEVVLSLDNTVDPQPENLTWELEIRYPSRSSLNAATYRPRPAVESGIPPFNAHHPVFGPVDPADFLGGPRTQAALILGSESTTTVMVELLESKGYTVDVFPDDGIYFGDPSPMNYDLVLYPDGENYGSTMPMAGQDALVSYIQSGGGLITTEWVSYEVEGGRLPSLMNVLPMRRYTGGTGGVDYYVNLPGHPIAAGVPSSFNAASGYSGCFLVSGDAVFSSETAGVGVAADQSNGGRVVQFAAAGNYSGFSPFGHEQPLRQVLDNAIDWVTRGGWLSATPLSGTVTANTVGEIVVSLNATGLNEGIYEAVLHFTSDQLAGGFMDVPVTLSVDGDPSLAVEPLQLDFGPVFVGSTSELTLLVSNQGTAQLEISSFQSDNPAFSFSAADLSLAPGLTTDIIVYYSPTSVADDGTVFHLLSNDPNQADLEIQVTAQAVDAPVIAVAPSDFQFALDTNTSETLYLTVDNGAGGSPLEYQVGVIYGDQTRVTTPSAESRSNTALHVDREKGAPETRAPRSAERAFGGPDDYGYRWMDSDTPGGPVYDWLDIRGFGEGQYFWGDDDYTSISLPFTFPYYGWGMNEVYVGTNGYVSFWDSPYDASSDYFPDSNYPNGIVSPLWADLNAYNATLTTWHDADNGLFYIQVDGLQAQYFSGEYSYQMVLRDNGDITIYYTQVDGPADQFAVGLEDPDGYTGLTVVYYSNYPAAGKALRFSYNTAGDWLALNPLSGSVPAGESAQVEVSASALGNMIEGVYQASLVVTSNDPQNPEVFVPVSLEVFGQPLLDTDQELAFNTVFTGLLNTRYLPIGNSGTADLYLTPASQTPDFVVDGTELVLAPFSTTWLRVDFQVDAPGSYQGVLALDWAGGTALVNLSAEAILPPVIVANPLSFDVTLDAGSSTTETLDLSNLGGSDLNWSHRFRNLQMNSNRSTGIGYHVRPEALQRPHANRPHPADPGQPIGPLTEFGDVLSYRDDFVYYAASMVQTPDGLMVLEESSGGEGDSNGGYYGTNTIRRYDPATGENTYLFDVPDYTMALAWDGDYLWVGDDSGVIRGYDGSGFEVGNFYLPNFDYYNYLLVHDGQDFVVITPDQQMIQRVDYAGNQLEQSWYDNSLGYFNAACWVPGHFNGHLWMYDSNNSDIVRFGNDLTSLEELDRIDFDNFSWTRCLAHDGQDLLLGNNWGELWTLDDGITEIEFFTLAPGFGSLPANGSTSLDLLINTPQDFGGTVTADLVLDSNDPANSSLSLPITLTVIGRPRLALSPEVLEFGDRYIGSSTTRTVEVTNTGSELLQVSNIIAGLGDYSTDATWLDINPGETHDLQVTFAPAQAGVRNTLISLVSNDPETPIRDLTVSGVGLESPELSVNPELFTEWLASGSEQDYTLTLDNSGLGELSYSVDVAGYIRALPADPAPVALPVTTETKLVDDPRPGVSPARGSGGPDAFGYTWRDSDEINGPAYLWYDIVSEGVGTNLFLGGDDNYTTVQLPFAFPFYGNSYNAVHVSTNGYLTFGGDPWDYTNDPIPSTLDPNDYIAPLWDDLSGANNYYYWHDTNLNRVIFQYENVANLNGSGTYKMQAVLYASGTIDFFYHTLNGQTNGCTVGIENSTGTDGLQTAFNAVYLHNGLAIRYSNAPQWLTVTPDAGTVPGGSSQDLDLHVSANGLLDGAYEAQITVSSNDPLNPAVVVPFHLTVAGFADIVVGQSSLDFDTSFTGTSSTRTVTVQNVGTGHLTLSGLSTTGAGFSVEPAPVVIAPGFSRALQVYFNPQVAGAVAGMLTIECDDEDTPTVQIALQGNAIDPPVVSVDPESIDETIQSGQTIQVGVTVDNMAGATPLDYSIVLDDLGGELFELVGNSRRPVHHGADDASRDASWMEITPDGGQLLPGQSRVHTLTISAPLNYSGQYEGIVRVFSNDPFTPQVDVPVTVAVVGVPAIAYAPTATDFGSVFVGYNGMRQVQVSNIGSALLNVSAVLSDNAVFSAAPQVFSLNPGQSTAVTLTFAPDQDGAASATLSFISNDPDNGDGLYAVSGTGTLVPEMAVSPASLSSSLVSAQQETQDLVIDNTQGLGPLSYQISVQSNLLRGLASLPEIRDERYAAIPGKDERDTRPAVDHGSRGQGGPDGYGYRWIDSDEAGGAVYSFTDIRNTGTQLALSGDDSQAGLTLPFGFPFYGQSYGSVMVGTNGYFTFTGSATSYGNQLLPDTSVPNNLVAPFWDDLHFRNTGRVHSQYFPGSETFIIQWTDIQRYSGSGLYTFQAVLHASGKIQFMYAAMSGILNGATTGIENQTGTQGLTVAFNSNYLHNGLAIDFITAPDWLSVLPTSGTVPAGQSATVGVTFDATGLLDFQDDAVLVVSGNDPVTPEVQVPVSFTVTGDYSLLPTAVSGPVPSDGELQVLQQPLLSWVPGTNAENFQLYLWPASQSMPAAPTATTNSISYQVNTTLAFGTTYNWMVRTGNLYGTVDGPVWSFTVRTQPDLIVSSVSVPNQVFTEQEYEVSWVVTNQGAGATTVPTWYDRIYLSEFPTYQQGGLTYLGQATNASYLGSGESYANQATFTVPQGLTGQFYIHVITDAVGHVSEGNENNNITSSSQPMTFILTPPPDLVVSVVTAPTNGFSGQPFTVNWTVVNQGAGNANNTSWYDAVYVAPVGTSDPAQATYLGRTLRSGALVAGGSYSASATVIMPLENFGSQNFIVLADYQNVVFEHAFESNNSNISAPINVTLSPPADLAVTAFSHPAGAAPNEVLAVSWTVANNGFDVTETGSWQDRVYISADNLLDANDTLLRTIFHGGALQPGDSYDVNTTVTWPDNTPDARFLILKADWANDVFEHIFETNNLAVNGAVQPMLPNLAPIELISSGGGMSGQPLDITWTVANQGTGGSFGDYWYDNVYISQNQVLDINQATSLGSFQHLPPLAAGADYSETRQVSIPNGYTGTYYLHLYTDATNRTFEADETDNQMLNSTTVAIVLNSWANLQPATMSVLNLDLLASAGTIDVLYEVDNAGAGSIPAGATWYDRVYLSSSPIFQVANAYHLGTVQMQGPLDPGGDYTRFQSFNLPNINAGTWYLHLVSDMGNTVYEHINENDNILSSVGLAIASRPPSDLAITALTVPAQAGSGQMITVEYTVTNQAGTTAQSSWTDGIWFSADDQFSLIDDQLVKTVYHSGALANGAAYTNSEAFRVPDGIEGDWHVFVYTDRYGTLGEPDTDNNRSHAPIEVSLTPAPELVLQSFNAPANLVSGQPMSVTWTVENTGPGDTRSASFFDGLYLSQNSTLDNGDVQLMLSEHSGVLASGNSYSGSRSVSIPVYYSGNYYLILKSDSDDREYELNKTNNRSARLVTITQPDPSDLVVSSITVPASAETGEPVDISWVLENQGTNPANGQMCDGVYFSPDATWDINDPLIGVDCRNISIAPGGRMSVQMQVDISESLRDNEDGSLVQDLPGLAPGDYYVIVRTDLRNNIRESNVANNRSVSSAQVDVDMPELALGVPEPLTIQDGVAHYFRVSVPLGETLRISVDGEEGLVYSELYLGEESVPTRSNYNFVGARPYQIDQVALVPETGVTTYYVLLYGNGVHNISSSATILAQTVQFSIASATPDHGGRGGRVTLMIEGARFDSESTVALEDGLGNSATVISTTVLDASRIRATFEIPADAPLGDWDLVVSNPARVDTRLEDGFLVEEPTGAEVSFGYSRPGSMRRFGDGVYQISVSNNGNNDIPILSAILAIPGGTDYTIESDRMLTNQDLFPDSLAALMSAVPNHVDEQGWRLIPLNALDMAVGEVIEIRLVARRVDGDVFPLKFVVDGYTRAEFLEGQLAYIELLRQEVLASGGNTNLSQELVDLAAYPDEFAAQMLQAYVTLGLLSPEEIASVSAQDVSLAMSKVADLPRILDGHESLRDLTTCQTVLTWLELVGRLGIIAIGLITGALLAPVTLGVAAVMAVLGGLGLGMNIGALLTGNPGLLARIFCDETPVVASRDPNDIIGPLGYGDEHFIAKNQTMPFMIRFENDPELATAPAQVVTITQTFDSTLDLSSFRLGDFNFGPFNFDVPNNRAFFQQRLDVTDSLGIMVDFTAGLDVMNHRAFWTLSSIDPNTGLAPEDPMSGFLAVNDSTGAGEGFVTYTIRPKNASVTGEVILSEARIVFDENEPIDTPEIFHTIDAAGGTSHVTGYPAVSDSVAFTISWNGQDDEGGSGIASWDVYRSVNNSNLFELYQVELRDTSTVFTGSFGNTYNFFTIARDHVGNTEPMKNTAEASVFVSPTGIPLALDMPSDLAFDEDGVLTLDMADYLSGGSSNLVVSTDPTAELQVAINGLQVVITAGPDWNGSELVNFLVSDEDESVSDFVMITVNPVNDAPMVLNAPAELVIPEDGSDCSLDLGQIFSDVDGDTLSYTVDGAVNLSVQITGGMVCITPAADWNGSETLVFTADDGAGRASLRAVSTGKQRTVIASRATVAGKSGLERRQVGKPAADGALRASADVELLVTVTPVNDSPLITLPELIAFDEDGSRVMDFDPFVADVDNGTLTLSVQPTTNVLVAIDGLQVTFTAQANWNGSELVVFQVDDGVRTLSSDTTEVVVNPVNDAPMVVGLPDTLVVAEDSGLSQVDLAQYFSDVDGDLLDYTVEGDTNLQVLVEGSLLSITPGADWFGSESLVITASDASGLSGRWTPSIGQAGTRVKPVGLSGAKSGRGAVTRTAAKADSRRGLLDRAQVVTHSPLLDEQESVSGTLVVVVEPVNDAPVITLPPMITFDEDSFWQMNFASWIQDVDSANLGLSVAGATNLAVAVVGMDVTISAPEDWNGSECLVFSVDDFEGRAIASDTLCVTVVPVNDAPTVVTQLDTLRILQGGSDNSLDLGTVFDDVDGDLLSYSVSGNNQVQVVIDGDGRVQISSPGSFVGEEHLVFTADDGQGQLVSWKAGVLRSAKRQASAKDVLVDDGERASASEDLVVIVEQLPSGDGRDLPVAFALEQNFPNPFNPTTTIRLAMPETGPARVVVYDMTGRLVRVLHDGMLSRGHHRILFDGGNLPSGVYVCRAEGAGHSATRKMMLVK